MIDEKREAVLEATADVFAQYGFKRTSMNDIALAAGISRPALYLMFDNKEHLFRELIAHIQQKAIKEATAALDGKGSFRDRITEAIIAYERVFYEPVAQSPHGAELIDVNLSIAADVMQKGQDRFLAFLAAALKEGINDGEISFAGSQVKPAAFVDLLMSSIGGLKKSARNTREFRTQIRQVAGIFLDSVSVG